MKKLLSILGAMGLVATASATVVACGSKSTTNNPNYSYNDFKGWVNESKNDNINEIIFIGGRKDVDSLSFLAAREKATGKNPNVTDVSKMTDSDHIKDADNDFNNWVSKRNDNSAKQIMSDNELADTYISKDQEATQESALVKDYFWDDANGKLSAPGLKLHSVLVDDLTSFWKNGLGKDILDGLISDQAKSAQDFYYSDKWNKKNYVKDHLDKDEAEKQLKATNKSIAKSLQGNNGPFFLVISKGKLAGVTTGFKHYHELDENADKDKNTLSTAANDLAALFDSFKKNVWFNIYDWLQNNWFPNKDASSLIFNNKNIGNGWEDAGSSKTYTPPTNKKTDDSNSESDDNKTDSGNKTTFAVDPTKYIN